MITPDSPLRRTTADANDKTGDSASSVRLREKDTDRPAPSRIGQIPKYGLPAASGASDWGYDSLNRKRKKPKYYPGQVKPKPEEVKAYYDAHPQEFTDPERVRVEYVDSPIMNQLSFRVSSRRFRRLGFRFTGSLAKGIADTVTLFDGLRWGHRRR